MTATRRCPPQQPGRTRARGAPVCCLLAPLFFCLLSVGCSQQPTTQPSTMYERQEQALKDPYGYNPDLRNDPNRVSGNGDFDRQGIRRDWDHVINP